MSIGTVKDYSMDPHNSIYWWLHNRTIVAFTPVYLVTLTIQLHPEDASLFGAILHKAFIAEFQSKNLFVIAVLAQNGIPVIIDPSSGIVENDRAERLPVEVVQVINSLHETPNPIVELAKEIRTWMRAIRYDVTEPLLANDRYVDMVATLEQGALKQRVLVRCVDGEIAAQDVDELDGQLDRKITQGWLISDRRVSDSARKQAFQNDAVQLFNFSEFLRLKVWEPYFVVLRTLVETIRISDFYVDIGCYKQITDEEGNALSKESYPSLDEFIDSWLRERGKMHISLLGDFGSGKTWFCRHYAYRQLDRYLENPIHERLPLLITLRAFAKAMTVQQLINDALIEQYKLQFVGSAFEVFQEMNRQGKLLLILDGFDEMARQVDYQTVVDNFWELARLVDVGSKVILTSRTEYFRRAKESEKILAGEEFGRKTLVLEPPKFEMLYLEPLNRSQIEEIITKRLGSDKGPDASRAILSTSNLYEIARKPVLIELLLAALEEVTPDLLGNQAKVYLFATNKLLLRNITADKTFTSTADKLYFLCELAWEMIRTGNLRIHYVDIPGRITRYFGDKIRDQHELDNWDFDLRNQTLLHRDTAGYYEFAHKSLAEFLVAFKFAAELGCIDSTFAHTYCEANNKPCSIPFQPLELKELAKTFGAVALTDERMDAVYNFLLGVLDNDSLGFLWRILEQTRGKSVEEVNYVGGNISTILRQMGQVFRDVDLSDCVLMGASLPGTDFTNSNLRNTCLKDADLTRSVFENSDCSGADLTNAKIWRPIKIYSISWSAKEDVVATCGNDGYVTLWDPYRLEKPIRRFKWNTGEVWSVCFSPDGEKLAVVGRGDCACIWDVSKWEYDMVYDLSTFFVCGVMWGKDGDVLYISGNDGAITRLFIGRTFRQDKISLTNRMIYCLAQNPKTGDVAAGCAGGRVLILDGRDLEIEHTLDVLTEDTDENMNLITSVSFSPNGDLLLAANGASEIIVWNASQYGRPKSIFGNKSKKKSYLHEEAFARSIAFSDNGELVAVPGCFKELGILAVNSWDILHSLPASDVSVCFSPGSTVLVSAGNDSRLNVWDFDSKSSTYCSCINSTKVRLNCIGMRLANTLGLDKKINNRSEEKSTLLTILTESGAIV